MGVSVSKRTGFPVAASPSRWSRYMDAKQTQHGLRSGEEGTQDPRFLPNSRQVPECPCAPLLEPEREAGCKF